MKSRIPPRGVPLPPNFCSLISIVRNPLQPHKLLALYHTMVMARAIDRRLWVLHTSPLAGEVGGVAARWGRSVWITTGAEAIQVAAAAALRPGTDWIVPHHRDLALCLALGVSPLDVMLTALGRASALGSRQPRTVTTPGLPATPLPPPAPPPSPPQP